MNPDNMSPRKPPTPTVEVRIRALPLDTHTRLKMAAAAQRKTLEQYIIDTLQLAVK